MADCYSKEMHQNKDKDKSESTVQGFSGMLELVEQLAAILERTNLTEVCIRENEVEVRVSRHPQNPFRDEGSSLQPVAANMVPSTQGLPTEDATVESSSQTQGNFINAPMPSRFYRSAAPGEPPFVEVGNRVSVGEPVAVLEVMKTYNPVEAPFNCEILEILVQDGEAVEYNQPLFRIKPQ